MKAEIRELEVELIPETDHEREAIARILTQGHIGIDYGRSTGNEWPPNPKRCSMVVKLVDPTRW